jgi:hypothetical protein
MKVICKKSIIEQICDLKYAANAQNKEIDYIEVTRREALQLYDEVNSILIPKSKLSAAMFDDRRVEEVHNSTVCGCLIKVNNITGTKLSDINFGVYL